jgi:hypothetical protein
MFKPNRYQGPCSFCGAHVAAGAGTWDRAMGTRHPEGGCKTTTKTYRASVRRKLMNDMRAAIKDAYQSAGFGRLEATRVDDATEIMGHGLRAYVGGYKPGTMKRYGVRVYRDYGHGVGMIHECAEPSIETGDYYADRIAEARALIGILAGCATWTAQ